MDGNRAVPLADVNRETARVAAAMAASELPLRLIGGGAIYLRCAGAQSDRLRRVYADLDFVGLSTHTTQIKHFFEGLGYEPDTWFNKLHGRARLLFWDEANNRQADVFLDRMNMCHLLDFRERIEVDPQTLSVADLLLTKLQIVRLNRKDLIDIVALLVDHPIGDQDGQMVNAAYIARLTAGNWGLCRTVTRSLGRVREALDEFREVGPFALDAQIDALLGAIEAAPKSIGWRLRSLLGERVRWYELPEEVRRD